jgi:histidine triad (HIT) family protein
MSGKTTFQRIIDKEIIAKIAYEDDLCLAFHDVKPQAPVHVLVIPKRPIVSVGHLTAEDQALAGHLLLVVKKVADQLDLSGGYRVVANCGPDGGQSVDHLHFHILGGRQMGWPPG